MAKTGVEQQPLTVMTPMEILQKISEGNFDKLWPRAKGERDDNAGNRARLFTDMDKSLSDRLLLSDQQLKDLPEMIKGFEPPATPEQVKVVLEKFDDIAKDLTGRDEKGKEQWNAFWEKVRTSYDPALNDEEIKQRQGDVKNAYRMKIFAMAQKKVEIESLTEIRKTSDPKKLREELKSENFEIGRILEENQKELEILENKDPRSEKDIDKKKMQIRVALEQIEKNEEKIQLEYEYEKNPEKAKEREKALKEKQGKILLFKDLLLKINIADRDTPKRENRDPTVEEKFEHMHDSYKEKVALNILLKFDVNEIILKEAILAIGEGKSETEVRNAIKEARNKMWKVIEDTPMGDPNADKYMQLFGNEKGKIIFDKYFSEKILYNKAMMYGDTSRQLNLDPINTLKSIEALKNDKATETYLSHQDKLALDEYLVDLSEKVYFPKKDIKKNKDLKREVPSEKYAQSLEKAKQILNMVSVKAAQEGNMELLRKCANTGFVSNEPITQYKRSWGQAFKDGFKDFPRNLGKLFVKEPRTPMQIAQISGQTELAETIAKQHELKDVPIDLQLDSKTAKQMMERLNKLEEKVDDLEGKLSVEESQKTSRTLLPQRESEDTDKLNKEFVKALKNYGANIYNNLEFKSPEEYLKRMVDSLAEKGCTSAIFFKAQALLGNHDIVKRILGGADIDISRMYEKNELAGMQELKKIKPDDKIAVHPNASPNTSDKIPKLSVDEILKDREKVVPLEKKRMN